MRDISSDPMSEMSAIAISSRESSMLRSKEKANEFSSLLCAYRLLDVIASLAIEDDSTPPPAHKKMRMNLSNNKVRCHSILYDPFLTLNRALYVRLEIGPEC